MKIIILIILSIAFITTVINGQAIAANHQVKTIGGTVVSVDAVGNVLTIATEGQHQMTFLVPDKINITQNTRDIGLMDIRQTHPLTIFYYISSSGQNTVISIVDNAPSSP